MTIREMLRQGFHHAWTCKWLWLFGFFVGITMGGSGGAGRGSDGAAANGDGPFGLSVAAIALIAIPFILAAIVAFVMRFISEGALIEGISRARQGRTMRMREGFGVGWAHWGVLVRIALLYLAALLASVGLLAAPGVIALLAFGPLGGVAFAIPALFIALPWLVTLYLVQAFAMRIAVLENRHALDAIGKARLFLHGRLMHGLKLIVATFVGTLAMVLTGLAAIAPVVLLLVLSTPLLGVLQAIVVGAVLVSPAIYVLAAMIGTLRSSIWTVGYVTQVES